MIRLPAHAARAIEQLEGAGFETWAVGGCVRDSLRGATPHDWDLCTAARPEQMKAVFAGKRVLETGLKHGTLTLLTGTSLHTFLPDKSADVLWDRTVRTFLDRREVAYDEL